MSAVGPLQRDPVSHKLMRDPVSHKLMRMGCHKCGRYTITFSGVNECDLSAPCALDENNDDWPSDLNTTFVLTYDGYTWQHEWSVSSGGWCICLTCDANTASLKLYAGYDCAGAHCTNDIAIAFGANDFSVAGGVQNNKITLGDCCTTVNGNAGCGSWCGGDASATGYGGTASIAWDNTGC